MQFKFSYEGKNPEKFVGDKDRWLIISKESTNIIQTNTSIQKVPTNNFILWFEQLQLNGIEIDKIKCINSDEINSGSIGSFNKAKLRFLNQNKRTFIKMPRILTEEESNKVNDWLLQTNPLKVEGGFEYQVNPNAKLKDDAVRSHKFTQLIEFFENSVKPSATYKDKPSNSSITMNTVKEEKSGFSQLFSSFSGKKSSPEDQEKSKKIKKAIDYSNDFNSLVSEKPSVEALKTLAIQTGVEKGRLDQRIINLNQELLLCIQNIETAKRQLDEAESSKNNASIAVEKLSGELKGIDEAIHLNQTDYDLWIKRDEVITNTIPEKQTSLKTTQKNLENLDKKLLELNTSLEQCKNEATNLYVPTDLANLIESYNDKKASLEESIQANEKTKLELEKSINEFEQDKIELEKIESVREEILSNIKKNEIEISIINNSSTKIPNLMAEISSATARIASIAEEKNAAELAAKNSFGILDSLIYFLKLLGFGFKTFNDVVEEKSKAFIDADNELSLKRNELFDIEKLAKNSDVKINTFDQNIALLNTELNELNSNSEGLTAKISEFGELDKKHQALEDINVTYNGANIQLGETNQKLTDFIKLRERSDALTVELEKITQEIDTTNSEKTNSANSCHSIEQEIQKLTSEQSDLQKNIKDHLTNLETLKDTQIKLEEAENTLRGENENFSRNNATYTKLTSTRTKIEEELNISNENLLKVSENASDSLSNLIFYYPEENTLNVYDAIQEQIELIVPKKTKPAEPPKREFTRKIVDKSIVIPSTATKEMTTPKTNDSNGVEPTVARQPLPFNTNLLNTEDQSLKNPSNEEDNPSVNNNSRPIVNVNLRNDILKGGETIVRNLDDIEKTALFNKLKYEIKKYESDPLKKDFKNAQRDAIILFENQLFFGNKITTKISVINPSSDNTENYDVLYKSLLTKLNDNINDIDKNDITNVVGNLPQTTMLAGINSIQLNKASINVVKKTIPLAGSLEEQLNKRRLYIRDDPDSDTESDSGFSDDDNDNVAPSKKK